MPSARAHYALVGRNILAAPLVVPRTELRRLLVFFGGVDPDNLTGRVLEALLDPALANLAVDVVLGLQSPHRQAVEELVARRPCTTLHGALPSLAGLILRADLAIGAGGVTTWERACLGLPSLVVAIAANQVPFLEALAQAGYLQLLGCIDNASTEQIRSALLKKLAEDPASETSTALTDGYGTSRVALAMLGIKGSRISLRPAVSADEALLLRWANDPQVRANSFSPEPILPVDHHHWFQQALKNPNRLLFIATTADGHPIGGYLIESAVPRLMSVRRWWICRSTVVLVAMVSLELEQLGLLEMNQRWGSATNAVAEVLSSNTAGNACFARAGFSMELEFELDSSLGSRTVNRWLWRQSASA